ncbi:hypothetical protein COV18_03455 [Candidatus Woesearchaeota archaeon CG10_big_fil_rev_8_21_14_0_10_37_12]|nr:MAG: hypothetical protein COV18_03455 [Candidatus Woesearchaeota archaeon CG10_big_fil_rev_8_21_14_0_10_37_12]
MDSLPITALSLWTYCPKQFYKAYILGIKEPINKAMLLGSIKHKIHELTVAEQQNIILQNHLDDVETLFKTKYTDILRKIIIKQKYSLKQVQLPLTEAFQQALPVALHQASDHAEQVQQHTNKGLSGEQLWETLTPKIKTEYTIRGKQTPLHGRIDKLACYPEKLIPIELKSGETPKEGIREYHKIQAAAYALLLNEQFGNVNQAIVHYIDSNTQREIKLNPYLIDEINQLIKTIQNTLKTKETPKGCQRETCTACNQQVTKERKNNNI